jgi:hypothetical protein
MSNVKFVATKSQVAAARANRNPLVVRAESIARRVANGASYQEAVRAYDANQRRIKNVKS